MESVLQCWVQEDNKQDAILKALQDSRVFDGTFVKAKRGEQQPDIRMSDQIILEIKLAGGAGDASVQNMVNILNSVCDLLASWANITSTFQRCTTSA